jgi:hypothetical protein
MAMKSNHKVIYTIMPDFGSAYGWIIRDGDESRGVGPNHASSLFGWRGNHLISDDLRDEFEKWQSLFERQVDVLAEVDTYFDWKTFHEKGLELCLRLKQEVGDVARIVYEKPFEDPEKEQDERREILSDGTLLPLPGRKEVYCIRLSRFIEQIVSGGQTGADRAALDWAIEHSLPHGGWCPAGRLAEDGIIDARYQLKELPSDSYRQRTRKNVENSKGTLLLNLGKLEGGSLETQDCAKELKKPCLVIQLDSGLDDKDLRLKVIRWLKGYEIKCLNIAGPRESERKGIYEAVMGFLNYLDQGYDPPALY